MTPLGATLLEPVRALAAWASQHHNVGAKVGSGVAVGANVCVLGIPVNLGLGVGVG